MTTSEAQTRSRLLEEAQSLTQRVGQHLAMLLRIFSPPVHCEVNVIKGGVHVVGVFSDIDWRACAFVALEPSMAKRIFILANIDLVAWNPWE